MSKLKFLKNSNVILAAIIIAPILFGIGYVFTAANCIGGDRIFTTGTYGYFTCVSSEMRSVPIIKPINQPEYYLGDIDNPYFVQRLHYKSSASVEEIYSTMNEELSKYGYSPESIRNDESNPGYIKVKFSFTKHLRFEKFLVKKETFNDEVLHRISGSIEGSEIQKVLAIDTVEDWIKDKNFLEKYPNIR